MATTRSTEPQCFTLSEEEAAPLIHKDLKPRTMERWRRDGTGPAFVRIGRRIGYTRAAIEAWLEARTYAHTAAEKHRKARREPRLQTHGRRPRVDDGGLA